MLTEGHKMEMNGRNQLCITLELSACSSLHFSANAGNTCRLRTDPKFSGKFIASFCIDIR